MRESNPRHKAVGVSAVCDERTHISTVSSRTTSRADIWVQDADLPDALRKARELADGTKVQVMPSGDLGSTAIVFQR